MKTRVKTHKRKTRRESDWLIGHRVGWNAAINEVMKIIEEDRQEAERFRGKPIYEGWVWTDASIKEAVEKLKKD